MQERGLTSDQSFGEELLQILRAHSTRDPILAEIRQGKLSREGVKRWSLQAMIVVSQFTRFISGIHSNCPDRDAQRLIAENLWEEHGLGELDRDHLSLIKRMARSLGADDREIETTEALPATAEYIEHCLRITRDGSFVEGMAAIGIGIEYSMPVFFRAFGEALKKNYGLTDQDVEFLSVHVEEDEEHSRRSIELIERFASTEDLKSRARDALHKTLSARQRFAAALFEHCSDVS